MAGVRRFIPNAAMGRGRTGYQPVPHPLHLTRPIPGRRWRWNVQGTRNLGAAAGGPPALRAAGDTYRGTPRAPGLLIFFVASCSL